MTLQISAEGFADRRKEALILEQAADPANINCPAKLSNAPRLLRRV